MFKFLIFIIGSIRIPMHISATNNNSAKTNTTSYTTNFSASGQKITNNDQQLTILTPGQKWTSNRKSVS